jgi:SAM-dependent methyltransferase
MKALEEFLPPAPGGIIDIGGGPGRYAFALAAKGYRVTLLDLAEKQPRDRVAESIGMWRSSGKKTLQGNALDLTPFCDHSFDAACSWVPLPSTSNIRPDHRRQGSKARAQTRWINLSHVHHPLCALSWTTPPAIPRRFSMRGEQLEQNATGWLNFGEGFPRRQFFPSKG